MTSLIHILFSLSLSPLSLSLSYTLTQTYTVTHSLEFSRGGTLSIMESVTRFQIMNEAICVSPRTNALGKGMNPTIPFSHSYMIGKTGLFCFGSATNLRERKLNLNQL